MLTLQVSRYCLLALHSHSLNKMTHAVTLLHIDLISPPPPAEAPSFMSKTTLPCKSKESNYLTEKEAVTASWFRRVIRRVIRRVMSHIYSQVDQGQSYF